MSATTTTNTVPSVMLTHELAPPGPGRWTYVCPDCAAEIDARELRAVNVFPLNRFYECPACAIGSLRSAWDATRICRRA